MHEVYLSSVKDTLLVAIPFVAVVALAIFRLDTLFAASKQSTDPASRRRQGCGMDENGGPLLVDPDGRPSDPLPKRI
jgi:hypothetical protein